MVVRFEIWKFVIIRKFAFWIFVFQEATLRLLGPLDPSSFFKYLRLAFSKHHMFSMLKRGTHLGLNAIKMLRKISLALLT